MKILKWCLSKIGVGISIVLAKFCPLCFPAIAGFLSSLGLGFLLKATALHWLLIIFLLFSILSLVWSYFKQHRRYIAMLIGVPSASFLYGSKYIFENSYFFYLGAVGLVIATFLNLILRRRAKCSCSAAGSS